MSEVTRAKIYSFAPFHSARETLRFRFTSLRSPSLNKDYEENGLARHFPKLLRFATQLLIILTLSEIDYGTPLMFYSKFNCRFSKNFNSVKNFNIYVFLLKQNWNISTTKNYSFCTIIF